MEAIAFFSCGILHKSSYSVPQSSILQNGQKEGHLTALLPISCKILVKCLDLVRVQ